MKYYRVKLKGINWELSSNHNYCILEAENEIQAAEIIEENGLKYSIIKKIEGRNLKEAMRVIRHQLHLSIKAKVQKEHKTETFKGYWVHAINKFSKSPKIFSFFLNVKSSQIVKKVISQRYWAYGRPKPIIIEEEFIAEPAVEASIFEIFFIILIIFLFLIYF